LNGRFSGLVGLLLAEEMVKSLPEGGLECSLRGDRGVFKNAISENAKSNT